VVRYVFYLLFVCSLLPSTAEASYYSAQYRYRHYPVSRQTQAVYATRFNYGASQWRARAFAPRRSYASYGHFSGSCATAAALGGPCGCEAMKLTGLSDRRFWLVSNWRVFPSTSPHVGAAALWGNQHVEIVTAVNGDGTVNTAGSVGHSHVRIAALSFVDPHAGAASVPTPTEQAASTHAATEQAASAHVVTEQAASAAHVATERAASAHVAPVARPARYPTVRVATRYRYASAFRGYGRATFMRSPNRGVPQDVGWANDYSSGRSL
jgi:hypothetical protein